jgi:hypothetical protein
VPTSEHPPSVARFALSRSGEGAHTLSDGIRLVNAIRTVGTFMKWVIVGLLGILAGFVMVGESIAKIAAWIRA